VGTVERNRNATKAYQQLFEDWCREKRVRDITEEVLLAYFEQKSRKLKGSTLWSNFEGLDLLEIFRTYFSLRPSPIEITRFFSWFLERKMHKAGSRNKYHRWSA
jgi:hypothetical protein